MNDQIPGVTASKTGWRSLLSGLLPFFVVAHCSHHLLTALLTPLSTFIRDDFSLSYSQTAWMMSAFRLSYGTAQLPAGWLADRVGRRTLITIGICGVGLAGLLVGISPTYLFLVTTLIIMGILGGGYHPSASPLVSSSVRPEMRGRALGFHLVGGSASFFLAPLIGDGIASIGGWRASYLILTIPTIIFGLFFYILMRRRLPDQGLNLSTRRVPGVTLTTRAPISKLRLGSFIAFTTIIHATTMGIVAFIPLYMVDTFDISNQTAGSLLSLVYSAGLWASLVGGSLSDRFGHMPVVLGSCLVAGPAVFLLKVLPLNYVLIGMLLVIIGMTNAMRGPVAEAYLISRTSSNRRSTVLGIYYFGNMEASGVMMPLLGYLIERFSFQTSFTIAAVVTLALALLFSLFFWHQRYQKTAG